MRLNPTPAENALWQRVRGRALGARFHRQVVLRGWIADFWCPAHRLIVEVDGGSHKRKGDADAHRDARLLAEIGARTLRFSNEQVIGHCEDVLAAIRLAMN